MRRWNLDLCLVAQSAFQHRSGNMIALLITLLLFAETEGRLAYNFESLHARIKEKHYEYHHYTNNKKCVLSTLPLPDFRIGYYLVTE